MRGGTTGSARKVIGAMAAMFLKTREPNTVVTNAPRSPEAATWRSRELDPMVSDTAGSVYVVMVDKRATTN